MIQYTNNWSKFRFSYDACKHTIKLEWKSYKPKMKSNELELQRIREVFTDIVHSKVSHVKMNIKKTIMNNISKTTWKMIFLRIQFIKIIPQVTY